MFSSYCQVNLELRTPYNSLVIPTIPTIPKKKSENKYSYRAYNALAVVYTYTTTMYWLVFSYSKTFVYRETLEFGISIVFLEENHVKNNFGISILFSEF